MKLKTNIEATHENGPINIDLELEMEPEEMIKYISEVMPIIKEIIKSQKEEGILNNELWEKVNSY